VERIKETNRSKIMFTNFGLPTKEQWKRIAINAGIAFLTGFSLQLLQVGASITEPTLLLSFDFLLATLKGALYAGGFALYKFILALFEAPQVKQQ